MRFAEIALLLLPFAVFVAWRVLTPAASGPPRMLVIAVLGSVLAMAVLLFVLWYEEAEPPGIGYVPARLENGRVIPERIAPIASGLVEPGGPRRVEPGAPGRVESGTQGRVELGASGREEQPGQASPAASTPK